MTAALGDALRLLELPVDVTVDEDMLAAAYRDAARTYHPDAAPPELRDERTERMQAINVARDLVRRNLERLAAEPFAAFAPGDDGPPGPAWWGDVSGSADDLGVRWNPTARRIPWAERFEAARRALAIAVGDTVVVEEGGVLAVGTVRAFDSSVRMGQRTQIQGIPVELRRVGVEVEFPGGDVRTVDAAHVEASGWRCPVCLRTAAHGIPRVRPCPRCIRRMRRDYDRWSDLAAERRRLQRRLERLRAEPAPFTARRFPRYRELDDALRSERERIESLTTTVEALRAALLEAETAASSAERRVERARSEAGVKRRRADLRREKLEAHRVAGAITAVEADLDAARARVAELGPAVAQLHSELEARHEAGQREHVESAARRAEEGIAVESRLRELGHELAALAPDAPAMLEGLDAWGQAPDRWLA